MDIGESALRAQIAWFRMLASRGFAHLELPGALAVATGLASNTDNGAALDPGSPAAQDVVAWLAGHDIPASVLLTAPASQEWLERLLALGMRQESDGNEMGARFEELRLPRSAPDDIEIAEVTSRRDLELSFGVLRDADWFDQDEFTRRVEAAERMGYGPDARVRHWIARAGGISAGAATSFLFEAGAERTVALIHCCVVSEYQRRGIGSALTRTRVDSARQDGAVQAVLSPSPDGYELHSALGFRRAPTPPNRWLYCSYQKES